MVLPLELATVVFLAWAAWVVSACHRSTFTTSTEQTADPNPSTA